MKVTNNGGSRRIELNSAEKKIAKKSAHKALNKSNNAKLAGQIIGLKMARDKLHQADGKLSKTTQARFDLAKNNAEVKAALLDAIKSYGDVNVETDFATVLQNNGVLSSDELTAFMASINPQAQAAAQDAPQGPDGGDEGGAAGGAPAQRPATPENTAPAENAAPPPAPDAPAQPQAGADAPAPDAPAAQPEPQAAAGAQPEVAGSSKGTEGIKSAEVLVNEAKASLNLGDKKLEELTKEQKKAVYDKASDASRAQVSSANDNLRVAQLMEAELREAELKGVQLTEAQLREVPEARGGKDPLRALIKTRREVLDAAQKVHTEIFNVVRDIAGTRTPPQQRKQPSAESSPSASRRSSPEGSPQARRQSRSGSPARADSPQRPATPDFATMSIAQLQAQEAQLQQRLERAREEFGSTRNANAKAAAGLRLDRASELLAACRAAIASRGAVAADVPRPQFGPARPDSPQGSTQSGGSDASDGSRASGARRRLAGVFEVGGMTGAQRTAYNARIASDPRLQDLQNQLAQVQAQLGDSDQNRVDWRPDSPAAQRLKDRETSLAAQIQARMTEIEREVRGNN